MYAFVWDRTADPRLWDMLTGRQVNGWFIAIANTEVQAWELLKEADVMYWWHFQNQPTVVSSGPIPDSGLEEWVRERVAPFIRGRRSNPKAIRPRKVSMQEIFCQRPLQGKELWTIDNLAGMEVR